MTANLARRLALAALLASCAWPAAAQTTITTSSTVSGSQAYSSLLVGGASAPGPTLTITNNAGITITGSSVTGFTVGSLANPFGSVVQQSGTVTSNSALYLGFNQSAGNTTYSGSASYTLNGGSIILTGTEFGFIAIGRSSAGILTQNGGTITTGRGSSMNVGLAGDGAYVLTGGTFEALGDTNSGLPVAGSIGQRGSNGTLTINGSGAVMALNGRNLELATNLDNSSTNKGSATVQLLNGTLAVNGDIARGRPAQQSPTVTNGPGTVSFTMGGGTLRPYNADLNVGITTSGSNNLPFDVTLAANSLSTITGIGWKSGSAHTVTLFSNLVGSGSVQFTGGTVVLAGINTYAGDTTITSGTLLANNASALGGQSGAIIVNGGVLDLGGNSFTRTGSVTFAGGTLRAGTFTNNTVDYAGQAGTVSATLAGSVGLTKTTPGTLTLSGSNSYTGTTSINAGTLALTGAGALASTGAVNVAASGATFDISGITASSGTIGSLAGSAGSLVTLGSKSLFVGGNNQSTSYGGSLSGLGQFVKTGTGTLTISGNVTLSDNTNGLLFVRNGEVRQTDGTVTLARTAGGGGFLLGFNPVNGGGTATYTITGGTVALTNGATNNMRIGNDEGTGVMNINGVNARVLLGGTNNNLGGVDSTGARGTGTLNLLAGELAVNSLTTGTGVGSTGSFNFSGGSLRPYSQDTSIGRSGTGFTIALSGNSPTLSGLDAAAGTARNLTILTTLVNASGTTGGINVSGGTVTLSAANTYTGATTIAGTNATLRLSAAGSFANSSTIRVGNAGSSGAVLDLTSKTGTFAFTSGQTVGGIGTINIGSGKTVSSAGIWAPGNSIGSNAVTGNLSLSGTSQFELGTPGTSTSAPGLSDFTAVSGTLTLGGNLALINNANADGLGSAAGGVYRLFTYGSAVSGSYASVTANPTATTRTSLANITYGGSGTAAGQGVFLSIYNLAAGSVTSGTSINLGTVLKNTSLSQALAISNTAPIGNFSEGLNATFGTLTGGATTNAALISLLTAGGTSTAMTVGLGSATAGAKNGTVQVNFASNGDGTSGLAPLALDPQTVSLTATVLDPAVASFGSGPTALTTFTLNFGSVNQGDTVSAQIFSLFNLLQTAGYTADLALVDIISGTGNTSAITTDLETFNSLASGSFNSWQGFVNTTNQGTFSNTWTLQFKSANGGTAYAGDTTQTLTLSANVIVVPEPGAIALAGIGIAAAAWALRSRSPSRKRAG